MEWAQAEKIIPETSHEAPQDSNVKPPTSTLALLFASTGDQVCHKGCLYLHTQGVAATTKA